MQGQRAGGLSRTLPARPLKIALTTARNTICVGSARGRIRAASTFFIKGLLISRFTSLFWRSQQISSEPREAYPHCSSPHTSVSSAFLLFVSSERYPLHLIHLRGRVDYVSNHRTLPFTLDRETVFLDNQILVVHAILQYLNCSEHQQRSADTLQELVLLVRCRRI